MHINKKFALVPHRLGLYPIVDSLIWLQRLLDLGITTIQLRIKNSAEEHLHKTIMSAVELGNHYNIRLFINDYWKLAIKYKAYGVHLGQEDMYNADPDKISKAGLKLGLSTHSEIELSKALSWQPSYISLGHIFPTNTKKMSSNPQGLTKLSHYTQKLNNISTVAIGGINLNNIEKVLDCGVGGISLISAIINAQDWHIATIKLLETITKWEQKHMIK
ncbi:thiamine phosphate synthase (plasmid) [Candidatus Pantoea edessiphila]|uniref:Thiamine-phosphate synthase n=1 Tax=Candidatus Pantoea edessiphila TaxID=2044610 RepID=A0A2P5SX78_9GAMM|nr:thiamine phosphate synthase [Candidatus Pantoea edessiphila]MBK4775899.1 thiamine phosphate synthase [Pantoea sp. Edef]PPI86948.1 thiamine phosphate synthase [Candidatus Pantoea edessiphila]